MDGSSTAEIIAWAVVFVVAVVTVTGLARRVGWSAPVVLVLAGVAAAYIPGIPRVELEPEVILVGVLPPLLYAAAIRTSFIDVRARGDSIINFSVVLVVVTTIVIGLITWAIVPSLTLAAAFAFGAIVAPTDAVSVVAIAGRAGLPRRLVTVLEGESLLNDATALVALNAAIAAVMVAVTPGSLAIDFLLAIGGGVAVGLLVGWILAAIRTRLRAPVLDTSLSLVTPYLAYFPAAAIHGSGFLAVVVAGLYLGFRSPIVQSAQARIAERLNWRTVAFLLENAVFLLIGLQLPSILSAAAESELGVWPTIGISLVIVVSLIVVRTAWVLATTAVYRWGPRALRSRGWSWGTAWAASFAGMRGVVTLAAVFLLPEDTPQRGVLQLLAFVVVVVTLVQGLALPRFVRALKLPSPNVAQEDMERRRLVAEAKLASLEVLESQRRDDDPEIVISTLRDMSTLGVQSGQLDEEGSGLPPSEALGRLRQAMIDAERAAVLAARRERRYQERAIQAVLATLDAEEAALRSRHRD
ncbi:Na+/H+ antiporter [Compostimonas suwonensis]|uniref:CPA1 family monovalent cation:H+ antiporter n=1 Tax=Compostimonas suwonensis TaxID=1048394 RepID=A0A2M9BYT6_9MICO|nr:Na+/H+ antiporter [Compostimonas suwonensis]PJJ63230.1 CPA1 family monovalent cation:H+ antiporter [Compostimonas suwonensis]